MDKDEPKEENKTKMRWNKTRKQMANHVASSRCDVVSRSAWNPVHLLDAKFSCCFYFLVQFSYSTNMDTLSHTRTRLFIPIVVHSLISRPFDGIGPWAKNALKFSVRNDNNKRKFSTISNIGRRWRTQSDIDREKERATKTGSLLKWK